MQNDSSSTGLTPQVGLVVVSHSRPLAQAAVDLALSMVHGHEPPVEIAAGNSQGGFGTDAVAIMEAILSANQGAGVVVIMDLGSALVSTDMALELLKDTGENIEVRVCPAPFVEGLTAAVVRAAGGEDVDLVAREAGMSLNPKLEQLGAKFPFPAEGKAGGEDFEDSLGVFPGCASGESAPEIREVTVVNRNGLHARPAAQIATLAASFPGEIRLIRQGRQADAKSPISIASLGARCGQSLYVFSYGSQAGEALAAVAGLISSGFGEELSPVRNRESGRVDGCCVDGSPTAGSESPRSDVPPAWCPPWESTRASS